MQDRSKFFIQFIQLAGPFWNSEKKATIRMETLALIVLTLLQTLKILEAERERSDDF